MSDQFSRISVIAGPSSRSPGPMIGVSSSEHDQSSGEHGDSSSELVIDTGECHQSSGGPSVSPSVSPGQSSDVAGGSSGRGLCPVCQETTASHRHYGGISCLSCKAFFR